MSIGYNIGHSIAKPIANNITTIARLASKPSDSEPPIPNHTIVNRDGAYILNRDGAYIIADPTPRTA